MDSGFTGWGLTRSLGNRYSERHIFCDTGCVYLLGGFSPFIFLLRSSISSPPPWLFQGHGAKPDARRKMQGRPEGAGGVTARLAPPRQPKSKGIARGEVVYSPRRFAPPPSKRGAESAASRIKNKSYSERHNFL